MLPYFERHPLRFSCTRCGRCCKGEAGYHVYLARSEAEAICTHLGLTWKWFRRHYLRRLDDGSLVAADNAAACIFLDAAGQCGIYAARPVQCRTYPFWPELVSSEAAWRREACRCEGISRGHVVPVARIRKSISTCLDVPG
jgi:Fe-S-cluster containining protein